MDLKATKCIRRSRSLPLSEGHFSSVLLAGHELDDVRRQIGAELDVRAAVAADLVVARRREYRQHLLRPTSPTVACQLRTVYIIITTSRLCYTSMTIGRATFTAVSYTHLTLPTILRV